MKKYPFTDSFDNINPDEIPIYGPIDIMVGRAAIKDLMNRMNPESERVSPDKHGCENIFASVFVNNDMFYDFPLIARDFLKHEAANMQNYKDLGYGDDMPQCGSFDKLWQRTIVHLMYEGAKQGSEYCISLFKSLFKTYYSKLYRSFKRFSAFSMNEILALSKEEGQINSSIVTIILCMAEMFDIKIKEECDVFYYMLNEKYAEIDEFNFIPTFVMDEKIYMEACKEYETRFPDNIKLYKDKIRSEKFAIKVLEKYGFHGDGIIMNMGPEASALESIVQAIAFLKIVYPKKEFTNDEILVYAGMYEAIDAMAHVINNTYDNYIDILGIGDDSFYEDEGTLFDPSKVIVNTNNTKKDSGNVSPRQEIVRKKDDREYSQEALLKEIDELRLKLRIQEQNNRSMRNKIHEAKKIEVERSTLEKMYEESRQELAALRSHLYHFTEYDENVDTVNIDEKIDALRIKKITIVGGHVNWVQKMKKVFIDWNYISPNVSVSNDSKWIENAEHVYFFTDTLSHSVYGTFMQIVREHGIPFGYIHGVNIDANINQLWSDLVEK